MKLFYAILALYDGPKVMIMISAPGYYFSSQLDLDRIQKMVEFCLECIRKQHEENSAKKSEAQSEPKQ